MKSGRVVYAKKTLWELKVNIVSAFEILNCNYNERSVFKEVYISRAAGHENCFTPW